ncbi:hypothetical protein MWH25_06345 [Natroniella acetigena]|uniref:UvrD-helicase domain-containing protein n=1 Tax=Natroniella acetigena TaxID=52004 RepID=UPI00200B8DC6|nr:UvrD-helicase domain-containing protein [Natroniella acetigena]MCK8827362.1 hypothetical protein [Natroniella acetigena]
MEKKIYVGPGGTGKTTKLFEKYCELGQEDKTSNCLVLLKNGSSVTEWRSEIEVDYIDSLEIFTYFGFVNREVRVYWDLIQQKLTGKKKVIEPTFMTIEPAQYIMGQFVNKFRERGFFAAVNATAQQIAIQLLDNLNQAALNNLSLAELQDRLSSSAAGDEDKVISYTESIEVIKEFRKLCLQQRCFDYSLVVDLYNEYLLQDENYRQRLSAEYDYLIVDNLELMAPVGQDLILKLFDQLTGSYLAFDPEGSFGSFFGAAPGLVMEKLFPECELVQLEQSYTSTPEARQLAEDISERIISGKPFAEHDFISDQIIKEDFRGTMLTKLTQQVEQLIREGVNPEEIALISPQIDEVLEFTLDRYFAEQDYAVVNLTQNKRLIDNRFAQALLVLALLVNPTLGVELKFSALVQTLGLLLDFDPVRSSFLAEQIIADDELKLPDLEEEGLIAKIGFNNSEKYTLLREWIEEKRSIMEERELELDYLFQTAFGELLSPLSLTEEDIFACRQMIESIVKFRKVINSLQGLDQKSLAYHFINMVNRGTLAAEVLFKPDDFSEQVILATPYTFLTVPQVKKVKYLFLLDISNDFWLQSGSKELSNPHISSKDRNQVEWNDKAEEAIKKEQLTDYLKSLLSKVTDGVFLADSYLSSRGWEQSGRLAEWLEEDYAGVISND